MAFYVRALKQQSVNPSTSMEEFINDLFTPYIEAGHIKDKSGSDLYLNKSRVSALLNQKDDVPQAMRKALKRYGIMEQTRDGFVAFVAENFISSELHTLIEDIQAVIRRSNHISEERKLELQSAMEDPSEYLLDTFFEAIRLNNRIVKQGVILWKQGTNSLRLVSGDLFQFGFHSKGRKLVVIPVNTTFDTHVSSESGINETVIVSPNTIHGSWLIQCVNAGTSSDLIQSTIDESLKKQNMNGHAGNIGSIVTVPIKDVTFVLLAISRFDEQQIAHSTKDDLCNALLALLSYYNEHGNGYALYLPLMGTGRSRIGLSYAESYELIKSVLLNNSHLIQGEITIVATEAAMVEIQENATLEVK